MISYIVRDYAGESSFVCGSWVANFGYSKWAQRCGPEEYRASHPAVISALVEHGKVVVAEHVSDEGLSLLLGFAVGERDARGPIIHYVYVKGDYQCAGVGSALVRALFDRLGVDHAGLVRPVQAFQQMVTSSHEHATYRHALACGHSAVRTSRHDTVVCWECSREPVRYTHARNPGAGIAGQMKWRYTPYPAFCRGFGRS